MPRDKTTMPRRCTSRPRTGGSISFTSCCEHGASLETRNSYGGTVLDGTLWYAFNAPIANVDYPAVVRDLIEAGARVDVYPEMKGYVDAVLAGARGGGYPEAPPFLSEGEALTPRHPSVGRQHLNCRGPASAAPPDNLESPESSPFRPTGDSCHKHVRARRTSPSDPNRPIAGGGSSRSPRPAPSGCCLTARSPREAGGCWRSSWPRCAR